MPTSEDGLVLRVKHGDGGFGEDNGLVGITEHTNTDEGVHESLENVAFGGGCEEL